MSFSILLEHREAVGRSEGRQVRTSILSAIGPALVARGADKILVPVPGSIEHERAIAGLERLPAERRRLVELVDRDAEVLRRVREYLLPLRHQAKRWPEDAFVSFTETLLYRSALAAKHRAGVAHESVAVVRDFVPIINPTLFTGEARFRLADIVSLVCAYRPVAPEYPTFSHRADVATLGRTVWEIIRTSEFNELVAESGKLGYLRDPLLTLGVLQDRVRTLVTRPAARGLLTATQTAAELSGAGDAADGVGRVAEFLGSASSGDFRPPFFDLGATTLAVYRVAMEEAFPGASPLEGTIMVLEEWRAGGTSTSWLSVGEEEKLAREESDVIAKREAAWARAREAQARFYR